MKREVALKKPNEIINKYNIKLLLSFGSFGTKYMKEDSDLDLAYLSEELLNKEQELQLLEDLIHFYKFSNIDLVNLRKATPGLKFEIAKKGRIIFEDGEEFLKFQLYASSIFADTKHLREMRKEVLDAKLKEL